MTAAGAGAAAHAAERRRREQEEEEILTNYNANDLDGWEFKIVRSVTGAFGKRDVVERLRQEEAQAGWEMVEKFDNSRIRFKRRVERRSNDQHLAIDPYRTSFGIGEGSMAAIIIVGIAVLIGVALLIANFAGAM